MSPLHRARHPDAPRASLTILDRGTSSTPTAGQKLDSPPQPCPALRLAACKRDVGIVGLPAEDRLGLREVPAVDLLGEEAPSRTHDA